MSTNDIYANLRGLISLLKLSESSRVLTGQINLTRTDLTRQKSAIFLIFAIFFLSTLRLNVRRRRYDRTFSRISRIYLFVDFRKVELE